MQINYKESILNPNTMRMVNKETATGKQVVSEYKNDKEYKDSHWYGKVNKKMCKKDVVKQLLHALVCYGKYLKGKDTVFKTKHVSNKNKLTKQLSSMFDGWLEHNITLDSFFEDTDEDEELMDEIVDNAVRKICM